MVESSLSKHTAILITLAILGSIGIFARFYIRVTLIPGFFELTLGFFFSLLGGIIGGIPGGIFVGIIVGLGGLLAGGEFPLLPLLGNICLGIGTGYAIHVTRDRESIKYAFLVIIGGALIGGFLPTLLISLALAESLVLSLIYAVFDMIQAFVWAVLAIFVDRTIIIPYFGNYLYYQADVSKLELEE